jgi:hypothetical protein
MASDAGRVGMVLGGAALLVLLGGVAVIFATKGGTEEAGTEVRQVDIVAVDAPEETPEDGAVADAAGAEEALERLDTGGAAAALAEPWEEVEIVPAAPGDDAPPTDPEPGPPSELEGELADQATLAMEQAIGDGPKGDTGLKGQAPPPPKKTGKCQDKRVTKKDGVYHIPRGILDGYATSPGRAGELGSFWWGKNKKGQKTGVKMGKLPCPGLLRAAGFRRGDLVMSVNGAKPTSIARAVSIYSAARKKGSAEVIVRRGKKGKKKKVRLKYRFTD